MFQHVTIKNFKSLLDTGTELAGFNVLVGNNGAGKSSFLRAIGFMTSLTSHDSVNAVLDDRGTSFNDLVSLRAAKRSMEFRARVVLPASGAHGDIDAFVSMVVRKRRFCYVASEQIVPWDKRGVDLTDKDAVALPYAISRVGKERMIAAEGGRTIRVENSVFSHSLLLDVMRRRQLSIGTDQTVKVTSAFPILGAIGRSMSRYVHFEIWGPEKLRHACRRRPGLRLGGDGGYLASSIWNLRRHHSDSFNALLTEMRRAYPWLSDIEIREFPNSSLGLVFVEKSALVRRAQNKKYNPNQVSDGFLRMLALSAIRHSPHLYSTVAFEEPENGLHPSMIGRSARMLREIAASGTQVIVTTHSPLFLTEVFSECSAKRVCDELRLIKRGKDGATSIERAKPSIIQDAIDQGLGIGELWALLLGEEQLVGTED